MSTLVFKISLCYDEKWEIKLCISFNIYCRLPKFGMSTHVFKISLCYDEKWEIKLCISVNIYPRLPKLGMSTHVFKIGLCYDNKMGNKVMYCKTQPCCASLRYPFHNMAAHTKATPTREGI